MFLDIDLLRKLSAADRVCQEAETTASMAIPGNPNGAAMRTFEWGAAFALADDPTENIANRVMSPEHIDLDIVWDAIPLYRENGGNLHIEINPFNERTGFGDVLSYFDFKKSYTESIYCAQMEKVVTRDVPDVEVRCLEKGEPLDIFIRTHITGWNGEATQERMARGMQFAAGLHALDNWHFYLASVDGQPAACAQLMFHEDIAYLANGCCMPDFRGKGCQAALTAARVETSRQTGKDLIFSITELGSGSGRNMVRSGLSLAYNLSFWRLNMESVRS